MINILMEVFGALTIRMDARKYKGIRRRADGEIVEPQK